MLLEFNNTFFKFLFSSSWSSSWHFFQCVSPLFLSSHSFIVLTCGECLSFNNTFFKFLFSSSWSSSWHFCQCVSPLFLSSPSFIVLTCGECLSFNKKGGGGKGITPVVPCTVNYGLMINLWWIEVTGAPNWRVCITPAIFLRKISFQGVLRVQ